MVEDAAAARRLFQKLEKIAEGVFLTRNLVSEPANVLFPKSFAAEARKLEKLGVKVTVLGEKEMKKLGMGALLGVAQGSATEPQLLVMRWDGAGAKGGAPLALVGKGGTLDTGGNSPEPAAGMGDIEWGMGGAGRARGLAVRGQWWTRASPSTPAVARRSRPPGWRTGRGNWAAPAR